MKEKVFPGADESTPSLAQYFSWINNTNAGQTESQALANLAFFEWLHDEYGMKLDIYAFDAGAIDGAGFYGSMKSERFKRQFPNGFAAIAEAAARFGCRLGLWGGPDGFGDTEEEAEERIETMVSLCRDHKFMLFKFDAVCGHLRPEKIKYFVRMMEECRKYSPDLILLNHRLELGEGLPHATTSLWEGMEMYTDVHVTNTQPGIHNRVGELSRGLPPNLQRLTEDHGVCISSCVDYWEDSLIQQAFNRGLILAPETYGSPWLMRDDEYPRFARIHNLHRRYRDILVNGLLLPEENYGKDAVSRGDGQTRFLSLRNLSWERKTIEIKLNSDLGLEKAEGFQIRRMHPREKVIGEVKWGDSVSVEMEPFRACLIMITSEKNGEIGFHGVDGEIIRDLPGKDAELLLWALPGTKTQVRVEAEGFSSASLEGSEATDLLSKEGMNVEFEGESLKSDCHRKLSSLKKSDPPRDAESLYEATCFSANNNALELRELQRSGPTKIPAVQKARDEFFGQQEFSTRGISDQNLFDNDSDSFFSVCRRYRDLRVRRGAFRLDFGEEVMLDHLVLYTRDDYNLQPLRNHEATSGWVSADLKTWTQVEGMAEGDLHFNIKVNHPFRYFRMRNCPDRINEVRGFYQGDKLVRNQWRASNLFGRSLDATVAWHAKVTLDEIHEGSYLAIPVFGPHVAESVYAGAKCKNEYLGASRRAPSYPSNAFEGIVQPGQNYTYFIPLDKSFEGKEIDVYLLGRAECASDEITSEVWVTAYPSPHVKKSVLLKRG
jgi:hypothetical protein